MVSTSMRPLVASLESLSLSAQPRSSRIIQPCLKRSFTTSFIQRDWLRPSRPEGTRSMVGRPRLARGGSMRGTTVVWGDYGLRMKDHDRRISAKSLELAYKTISSRLRGMNYKLYTRVSANIGVYTKGNEVRMGKGKGKFDYWCARVPVSRVVFELSGMVHEKVVREAFRLAGNKLPGQWEFVKSGDMPVVGLTRLNPERGITLESLKRPRRNIEPQAKNDEDAALISGITEAPKTVSTTTDV